MNKTIKLGRYRHIEKYEKSMPDIIVVATYKNKVYWRWEDEASLKLAHVDSFTKGNWQPYKEGK